MGAARLDPPGPSPLPGGPVDPLPAPHLRGRRRTRRARTNGATAAVLAPIPRGMSGVPAFRPYYATTTTTSRAIGAKGGGRCEGVAMRRFCELEPRLHSAGRRVEVEGAVQVLGERVVLGHEPALRRREGLNPLGRSAGVLPASFTCGSWINTVKIKQISKQPRLQNAPVFSDWSA